MKNKLLIIIFVLFLISIHISYAYKVETGKEVHQHITNESQDAWGLIPKEIREHLIKPVNSQLDSKPFANYDTGDDIIIGSGEEDNTFRTATSANHDHFLDPDISFSSISGRYYSHGFSGFPISSYTKQMIYGNPR